MSKYAPKSPDGLYPYVASSRFPGEVRARIIWAANLSEARSYHKALSYQPVWPVRRATPGDVMKYAQEARP